MTRTYKKANIIVVFDEIFLRAELALNIPFRKIYPLNRIFQILCSMPARSCARKKISSNTTIIFVFLYVRVIGLTIEFKFYFFTLIFAVLL